MSNKTCPFTLPTGATWSSRRWEEFWDGDRFVITMDNGYGASVVRNKYSYGGDVGLWELAVLMLGEICYTTHITSDVIGRLDVNEVERLLVDIYNLPSVLSSVSEVISDLKNIHKNL